MRSKYGRFTKTEDEEPEEQLEVARRPAGNIARMMQTLFNVLFTLAIIVLYSIFHGPIKDWFNGKATNYYCSYD